MPVDSDPFSGGSVPGPRSPALQSYTAAVYIAGAVYLARMLTHIPQFERWAEVPLGVVFETFVGLSCLAVAIARQRHARLAPEYSRGLLVGLILAPFPGWFVLLYWLVWVRTREYQRIVGDPAQQIDQVGR